MRTASIGVLRALLASTLASVLLCGQTPQKRPTHAPARKAKPAAPKRSLLDPATLNEKAPETYKAAFTTTKGPFVVEVTRAWAPLGADRFYNLVKNRFYDGASFFRVVPGFVVQFGMSARPEVSSAWRTATIQDDPVKESNQRGSITFAKTNQPDTRSTQVFINLVNNPRLDAMGFSPFGRVVEGMDVVDKIYSGYRERPEQGRIEAEGKAYLDTNFPQLDSIKTAVIVSPARAPAHPATSGKKPAAPAKQPAAPQGEKQ